MKLPVKQIFLILLLSTLSIINVKASNVESRVTFKASDVEEINLEGILTYDSAKPEAPIVILCHPHPRGGGEMDNGQLVDFQKILYSRGYSSLRFNFRGVGKSEGNFGDGSLGDRDLAGALTFIENHETIKPAKIFLFGYSYGSMVAFNVALTDKRVNGAVLVGFPTRTIGSFDNYKGINNPEVPIYILAGGQDKISYGIKKAVTDFVASTYHKMKLTIIPTADHFFQGNWLNIFNASIQFYEDILAGKYNDTKESKKGSEQKEKQ